MDIYLAAIGFIAIIVAAASGFIVGRIIDEEKLTYIMQVEEECLNSLFALQSKIKEIDYNLNYKIAQLEKLHENVERKIQQLNLLADELFEEGEYLEEEKYY